MSAKPCLVIVDFNLTRREDVRRMSNHARARHGLPTLLFRSRPVAEDLGLADWVVDLDPLDPGFADKAMEEISSMGLAPRAVLPFSDNSVISGSMLARKLGLKGDSPELAANAFSKIAYRQEESRAAKLAEERGIFVPRFAVVRSIEEIESFAELCPGGFVLKPSCEGNNRGVIRLKRGDDLAGALEEVSRYLEQGLICEELIPFESEFSFDGIGSLEFMTEKLSSSGRYPLEQGQLVPARLNEDEAASIRDAGRWANLLVGQLHGPFHNEIRIDRVSGEARSAVIEPNRRPAGMRIWHLAEKVYGVDLFALWVERMLVRDESGSGKARILPAPRGSALIRMLPSPFEGRWPSGLEEDRIAAMLRETTGKGTGVEWLEFRILRSAGDPVTSTPRDGGDFVAQVSLYHPDRSFDLPAFSERLEREWLSILTRWTEVA